MTCQQALARFYRHYRRSNPDIAPLLHHHYPFIAPEPDPIHSQSLFLPLPTFLALESPSTPNREHPPKHLEAAQSFLRRGRKRKNGEKEDEKKRKFVPSLLPEKQKIKTNPEPNIFKKKSHRNNRRRIRTVSCRCFVSDRSQASHAFSSPLVLVSLPAGAASSEPPSLFLTYSS